MTLSAPAVVLIVEDDVLLALTLQLIVEDLGYKVIGPYHNLNDAVEHARRDAFDYGLLDFNLGPDTDSLPVAEVLTTRGVPFAFTSGTNPAIIRQSVPDARILPKPIDDTALKALFV